MKLLRIVVVIACGVALAASATANRVPAEPLARPEVVKVETPVEGIRIVGGPSDAAGWVLRIVNDTDASVSIIWDESSFVTSTGRSAGRLIVGGTRRIDMAKNQPAAPLAPHATLGEVVYAEKLYDREEPERDYASSIGADGKVDEGAADHARSRRDETAELLRGGKLYITVQTAAGKQTWVGVVTGAAPRAARVPAEPPNPNNDPARAVTFWCSASSCVAEHARCPDCTARAEVWCASDGTRFTCAATRDRCLALVDMEDRAFGECVTQRARGATPAGATSGEGSAAPDGAGQ